MVLGLETAHMPPLGQNFHISAQIQKVPRKSVFRIGARKLEICRYSEDGVLRPGTKHKRASPRAPSEKCKVNWYAPFPQPYRSEEIWIIIGCWSENGYLYRPIVTGRGLGALHAVGLRICSHKGDSRLCDEQLKLPRRLRWAVWPLHNKFMNPGQPGLIMDACGAEI